MYLKATCGSNLHCQHILQLKGASIALWQAWFRRHYFNHYVVTVTGLCYREKSNNH